MAGVVSSAPARQTPGTASSCTLQRCTPGGFALPTGDSRLRHEWHPCCRPCRYSVIPLYRHHLQQRLRRQLRLVGLRGQRCLPHPLNPERLRFPVGRTDRHTALAVEKILDIHRLESLNLKLETIIFVRSRKSRVSESKVMLASTMPSVRLFDNIKMVYAPSPATVSTMPVLLRSRVLSTTCLM